MNGFLIIMLPVRCFTCNKVIGNLWEKFLEQIQNGTTEEVALNNLGLRRWCCRRMLIAYVELDY